jgi:effector-binding domain-containing protein
MAYEVTVVDAVARPTAVVAAAATWQEFPSLWKDLLDTVWACLRAGGVDRGCPDVMLYLDDVPHVEVGVELRRPCPLTDPVVASSLPAGRAATTAPRGPFSEVGSAHGAVRAWTEAHGHALAGPRWEIYGPHADDPAELTTEVYWLLA